MSAYASVPTFEDLQERLRREISLIHAARGSLERSMSQGNKEAEIADDLLENAEVNLEALREDFSKWRLAHLEVT